MHYLHRDLLKNNYPYWIIKEPEKRPASPIINPDTGLEVKKNVSISMIITNFLWNRIDFLKNTSFCQSY